MKKKMYFCTKTYHKVLVNHFIQVNNVMAILTLEIENRSILEHLKSVLEIMKGVRIVDTSITQISEDAVVGIPNAVTLEAMDEAKCGNDAGEVRVDSLQAFIDSMK